MRVGWVQERSVWYLAWSTTGVCLRSTRQPMLSTISPYSYADIHQLVPFIWSVSAGQEIIKIHSHVHAETAETSHPHPHPHPHPHSEVWNSLGNLPRRGRLLLSLLLSLRLGL